MHVYHFLFLIDVMPICSCRKEDGLELLSDKQLTYLTRTKVS